MNKVPLVNSLQVQTIQTNEWRGEVKWKIDCFKQKKSNHCTCITTRISEPYGPYEILAPAEGGLWLLALLAWMLTGPDMEKVASMQALLAYSFWENCGHFWKNNEVFAVFTHQWPQVCIIYPQLIYFCSKISDVLENIVIYVTFLQLGDTWICGHFSI